MDLVISNARLATVVPGAPYGETPADAIAFRGGRIAWIGETAQGLPEAARRLDAKGAWLTPALVDCHTHLVHGGNRAREFEMRLGGASYEEIARAGGGINATVAATRAATEDELV